MDKSKAEILDVIKGALDGGPDAILEALKSEGCVSYTDDTPADDEAAEGEDPFAIKPKDDLKASRGKSVGMAMDFMKKKAPAFGGKPEGEDKKSPFGK